MKIETDDWVTLADVVTMTGIPAKTLYRTADRLGLKTEVFGVRVVRKSDIGRIAESRKRVGNPDWIGSPKKAAAAAGKAVESRRRRVETSGPTAAEVRRNKALAVIGATKGGPKKPRAGERDEG